MTPSRRLTTVVAVTVALTCALALAAPAYCGRTGHSYASERRVIRAGILVGAGAPSPYALYLLGSESVAVPLPGGKSFEFYPPRPAGWEIINPLATPGIARSAPEYWQVPQVPLGTVDLSLLQNFDLLLLPIVGAVSLSVDQQRALERWVDQGGLLWIDNQPGPGRNPPDDWQLTNFLGLFFPQHPVGFAARYRDPSDPLSDLAAPKVSVDVTHPLLRGRYPLSEDEVQLLGQQYAYSKAGEGTKIWATNPTGPPVATVDGLSPLDGIIQDSSYPPVYPTDSNAIVNFTVLQPVVGELYNTGSGERRQVPVIAAGYYGDGCIVVSACGIASAISDWYKGLWEATPQTSLELPQWALPDMRFAYNMIQWWMDWAGTRGRVRFRGAYGEETSGPPVQTWNDAATLAGALTGPAVVGRGLAFAGSSTGVLAGWDVEPLRDRDLEGQSDDGASDYAAGAARDLLWSVTVPWQDPNDAAVGPPARSPAEPARSVVGSPALNTTYDGTGPRRLVAVAVRTQDGLDSSLHAYLADPRDGAPVNPFWSATIKHYSGTDPAASSGLVGSGPVAVDEFFALTTTDSGALDAPNRDAHLLIYDAFGPTALPPIDTGTYNIPYEQPAAQVEMAEGGRAATFADPPATAMAEARDEVLAHSEAVQAAVMVGNSLPRPGPSAVGRLWVTPLMVRFPAPGWDRTWLADPSQPDTALLPNPQNQAVSVWINGAQVPPHMDDDPAQPLNYIRTTIGGQIRIIFSRWSLFARGRFPLGFGQVQITYRDTAGSPRTVTQKLTPGTPVALSGYVSEAGRATPCVFQDDIFVGTDAVSAYPNPSSEGRLAAYSLEADRATGPNWTFFGDRFRGQVPPADGSYYSSFSFTSAHARDTLFAAANYQFLHSDQTQTNAALAAGPSGALYALELKASPELVRPGTADPVLLPQSQRMDFVAPVGASADPNQTVAADRRGAAVWLSTSLTDDSARYTIPQMTGATVNWRVDFRNHIMRLGPGVFGKLACPVWSDMGTPADATDDRYVPQRVRVRYFSGGSPPAVETVMEVAPLVKWLYIAPDGWEFISSPVVTNGMVMVAAYDRARSRCLLLGFRAVPENLVATEPLWAYPAEPEYIEVLATGITSAPAAGLAVAEKGLVWSGSLSGAEPYNDLNLNGHYDPGEPFTDINRSGQWDSDVSWAQVTGLRTPDTIIADNARLLAADPGGVALASQESVSHPRNDLTVGAAGIPIKDSYAERMFEPLDRPRRVRALPDGNLLVVDAGANCVLELDPDGDVVWRYPNEDAAEQARLLAPSDAHRYSTLPVAVVLPDVVDPEGMIRNGDPVSVQWRTTLIADAGNYRVLEVARPLVNGRYRPDLTNAALYPLYVELVRVIAAPELTRWPRAAGPTTTLQAAFTTAERLAADATYPFLSANVMCAVGNSPADPLGKDQYVSLVEIRVADSTVLPRADGGINIFRRRTSAAGAEELPRDFINIRQADLTVSPAGALQTVIVDDVGVKVVDYATWNATLTPVFEMRGAAPWLPRANPPFNRAPAGDFLTTYEEEMAGGTIEAPGINQATRKTGDIVTGLGWALARWVSEFGDPTTTGGYPPLIREPRTGSTPGDWDTARAAAWSNVVNYAQATATAYTAGEVPFLPVYAKRQANGKYLIVNAYPNPYLSSNVLDVMAPVTSEVFEVDPNQPVGQRIVRSWDQALYSWNSLTWSHFIVPDPARSEYPSLRGGAGPLRQPLAVDRP